MKVYIRFANDHLWYLKPWYKNFATFYNTTVMGISNWENYVNEILNGIGKFHYANYNFGHEYIKFNSEEDYINFLLKWS